MVSKARKLFFSISAVRAIVRFAERNHLTSRSREDIYYGTNQGFRTTDTVLECFLPGARVEIRPKNFFRRLIYDWVRLDDTPVVPLEGNLDIRKEFRNIRQLQQYSALNKCRAAPTNNHGKNAVSRNAASTLLTEINWGRQMFSLSGSQLELNRCDGGYRGRHQATDFAFEERRDQILTKHPSLRVSGDAMCYPFVVISTDTINHLPLREKNAILANGVPLVSYTPSAYLEHGLMGNQERIQFWAGDKLRTNVNGGGNYVEQLENTTLDVKIVDSPDGGLVLVYVDSFQDYFDPTHIFMCETPFAYVSRNTREYELFKDALRPARLSPYTITTEHGTFSTLAVRHDDVIQITANNTRRTVYFTRSELMALSTMDPGFKSKIRLRQDNGLEKYGKRDDLIRYEVCEQIGFSHLGDVCKLSPEFNIPTVSDADRRSKMATVLLLATTNHTNEIKQLWPEIGTSERENIREYFKDHNMDGYLPSPDDDASVASSEESEDDSNPLRPFMNLNIEKVILN